MCGQLDESWGGKVTLSRVYPHALVVDRLHHKPEISACYEVFYGALACLVCQSLESLR
jgi:hypothetical protein